VKIVLPDSEDTKKLGFTLAQRILLRPSWGKDIFLYGDIGIGKTTFLQGFSRGLGIKEHINSPTFALVSEYPVPHNQSGIETFSHLDIFRVEGDSVLALPEIFEKLEDKTLVLALEWADKLPKTILPESRIEIRFSLQTMHYDNREAEIEFFDPGVPDDAVIREMLDEFQTPLFVRKHTAIVAKIATLIAKKLIEKNYPVHLDVVRSAALLHDLFWMCGQNGFVREDFSEQTDEKHWNTWMKMRETVCESDPFSSCESYLRQRGYSTIADVVARMRTKNIPGHFSTRRGMLGLGAFFCPKGQARFAF
jgi:tRNA threonylcarbamoyladenosine biosynthesis protein TsaE